MPAILRMSGFRFFFYTHEGRPLEPPHIHVMKRGDEAKFWLTPVVKLARDDNLDFRELRTSAEIIKQNQVLFLEAWNDYFG
jgi:hypothetical protein